jgi:hypothetical protein
MSNIAIAGKSHDSPPLFCLQDTVRDNQVLYNGRIWRNLYSIVQEDQFFLSREFIQGSVTIDGETFTGIQLKYDIFKDELLSPVEGGIIQLNKELIDSFSLSYNNVNYAFIKMKDDSLNNSASFYDVLYDGKAALYVRQNKKIDKMAVEGRYDKFYQMNKVYVVRGDKFLPVARKRDLLILLEDKIIQVNEFLKKNKLRITEKVPETFIPVLRFYDNLNK